MIFNGGQVDLNHVHPVQNLPYSKVKLCVVKIQRKPSVLTSPWVTLIHTRLLPRQASTSFLVGRLQLSYNLMLTIFTSATASFTRHNIKTIFAVSCLLFYSLRLCFDSKRRRSEAVKSLHRSLRSYLHNAAKLRNSEEGSPTNARSAVYVEGFESRYPATLL